ncbi:helix-turn-helix domain-containing protein [Actinopolymorpha pittospori]|nr:helix-turn-helix domain-containing protein [Actinopolymorpha pittospori]
MDGGVLSATGVTAEEEQAYVSLLREGPATLRTLVARLGLGRPRAAQVVAELQRKGLAHRTPAPHEAYVPVPPHVAVEQLIERRQSELAKVRDDVPLLAALARPEPTQRRTEELIEIVQGRAAVQHAFAQVQRAARSEVRVLDAPPYAAEGGINEVELSQLAAGVAYRGVYAEEALATPDLIRSIAQHLAAGEQARLAATVPTKLAVADHALALLPLSLSPRSRDGAHDWAGDTLGDPAQNAARDPVQDTAQDTAVLVHPCGLLEALIALFDSVWTAASPLVVTAAGEVGAPGELTELDRSLLSLLVAGLTDEAAAVRLRVSRRTVVRRVQHLMIAAGARSRLQLGWRAKELGWL